MCSMVRKVRIEGWVDPSTDTELENVAESRGVSKSKIIRDAVEKEIQTELEGQL